MLKTVLIADHDDPDQEFFRKQDTGLITYFPLANPANWYGLSWKNSKWRLTCRHHSLDVEDLRCADRIVFRRWRTSPPCRAVGLSDGDEYPFDQNKFIRRQWESTIHGLLAVNYRERPTAWSRNPLRADNKILNTSVLSEIALVPNWSITQHLGGSEQSRVSKAVSTDQSVGRLGRAMTTLIDHDDRAVLQPCPSVTQLHIATNREIRVFYYFGRARAVVHERSFAEGQVDSRAANSLQIEIYDVNHLKEHLEQLSNALNLRMFTADILLDHKGTVWWLDINPDGLISPYNDVSDSLSSIEEAAE